MANIICLSNQKGGVGKSVTTCNLGIGLARQGKRVLLLDNDPQASLTISLGYRKPDEIPITLVDIMNVIMGDTPLPLSEGIIHHPEGIDLMPASIELSGVEISLVNAMCRETILRQYIETIKSQYDYILIDTSPSLGMLTINALAAANSVIIPVQAEYLPARGLELLLRTVASVRKQINPMLEIGGILLTLVDERTNDAKETKELIHSAYGSQLYMYSDIPRSVRTSETTKKGKSVYLHDRQAKCRLHMKPSQGRCLQLANKKTQGALALASYDDIFQTGKTVPFANSGKVVDIPLGELYPPDFHPFQVRDDIDMMRLAANIHRDGVLIPGIARPRESGGYELVAGNRRKLACERNNIATMPVIIRNLSDDDAAILMV